MLTYRFDKKTKEFLCAEVADLDPLETEQQGKDVYLLPADSTFDAPPAAKPGYAVCWNGEQWGYIEDHRQKRNRGGVPVEGTGTPFWMPGDTWQTPARYMMELGKLPEGAMLERPEKTEKQKRLERIAELESYLGSTDWYAVRFAETGVPMPESVKSKRAAAREEISMLREAVA